MKPIVLRVQRLPRMNSSSNVHWRVKVRDRQSWGLLMLAALGRQRKPAAPLEHARVQFTRHSSRQGDDDNLRESFKLCRDLLQPSSKRNPGGLGLIAGDDPEHLEAAYQWQLAPRVKGWVEIVVEDALEAPVGGH